MKDAHRLYNNDFQRRGRSWSECLRGSLELGTGCSSHTFSKKKQPRLDAMIAASWKAHNARKEQEA